MTDITKIIEAMREAAEAVPEGERVWERCPSVRTFIRRESDSHVVVCPQSAYEADYIAAACPANVLAVLDAFDKTVALLHELTQAINDCAPEPPRD